LCPSSKVVALKKARLRADPVGRHRQASSPRENHMTRSQLVQQLAEIATRPIAHAAATVAPASDPIATDSCASARELFVWFEDTATRKVEGRRGVAGLPESLLPYSGTMRIVERRYATDHLHLLSAVRIACREYPGELIAAIYTAALSVGTVAWIGTGSQYERTWNDMYPVSATAERGD
jgi:hypothetical protein